MTLFWMAVLSLLASIFIFVFVPPRRIRSVGYTSAQANVEAYRQQLVDLGSEHRELRITSEQYVRDRHEIENRLASDLRLGDSATARKDRAADSDVPVLWLGIVTLLAAMLLYLTIGTPPR